MFEAPRWLTAQPKDGRRERHAIASGEAYTACGLPACDFIVLAEIPWRDGRASRGARPCDDCDDVAV